MNRLEPGRAGAWADALTIVSIVALGICVAAFVSHASPPSAASETRAEPRATSTETTSAPPEPADTTYRAPEVTYPTNIPGCTVVEPPSAESSTWVQAVTSEDAYDNPQYPWYSGQRSVMMTDAVAEALPDRVEVLFGSRRESLIFQPIPQTSPDPIEVTGPGFAQASAEMGRGDKVGLLSVSVGFVDTGVPPCIAGAVRERTTEADGAVVDINESWYEIGPQRTNFRTVTAYAPDGSQISATASDATGFQSSNSGERDIVLTIDELKALVQQPELRATTQVPPNTPQPGGGCDGTFGFTSGGPTIRAETAHTLNEVLRGIDVGERFDRGLNSLMLADFQDDVVCTQVDVLDTGADLSLTIKGGQELPEIPDVYDPAYKSRPLNTEILDGGAVLEVDDSPYTYSPAPEGRPNGGTYRTVIVTYPSGTQVEVRSHAENPDEPLGVDKLRTIATADGLDVL
ncbi:hypothetical protein DK926_05100 [Rhodococcus sp. Eu-32]|nr:hypothetical protein DK926_05100 [Rhodococcus sp. Eu-32]